MSLSINSSRCSRMYLDTALICMRFFMRVLRSFISLYSRCSFWAEPPFNCRSISITCQIVSVVAYTQPRICVSAISECNSREKETGSRGDAFPDHSLRFLTHPPKGELSNTTSWWRRSEAGCQSKTLDTLLVFAAELIAGILMRRGHRESGVWNAIRPA